MTQLKLELNHMKLMKASISQICSLPHTILSTYHTPWDFPTYPLQLYLPPTLHWDFPTSVHTFLNSTILSIYQTPWDFPTSDIPSTYHIPLDFPTSVHPQFPTIPSTYLPTPWDFLTLVHTLDP